MKKVTQEQQVIEVLRRAGGYATLRRLNELVDFSSWVTKTPEASVRRIVQNSPEIFKIQPGLWALEECRDDVMRKFELKSGNTKSEEAFTHGYYQGLLVEIGKFRRMTTYVPAQDRNRHLAIYSGQYGATPSEVYEYDVQRLSAKAMTWHLTNSDVVLNFKKVK